MARRFARLAELSPPERKDLERRQYEQSAAFAEQFYQDTGKDPVVALEAWLWARKAGLLPPDWVMAYVIVLREMFRDCLGTICLRKARLRVLSVKRLSSNRPAVTVE